MLDTTSLALDTTLPVLEATHPVGVYPALLDDRKRPVCTACRLGQAQGAINGIDRKENTKESTR